MRSNRNHVSRGDCAPGSTRSNATRALRIPWRPRYRSRSGSTSALLRRVARANASIAATAVSSECRHARRIRDPHAVDHADFVVLDPVCPYVHFPGPPTVGIDNGGWACGIDPTGAMKRRRREAGEDTAPLRSQPAGLCTQDRGDLGALRDVDVLMQCAVTAPERMPSNYSRRDCFTTDERPVHGGSVPTPTDTSPPVTRWREIG